MPVVLRGCVGFRSLSNGTAAVHAMWLLSKNGRPKWGLKEGIINSFIHSEAFAVGWHVVPGGGSGPPSLGGIGSPGHAHSLG
mmetsp:Transcript_6566/g.16348  ORF Transcript_6566/g.16348 Transcript_6566/m.16348 type:complete len:82 (+) Transcript_6566:165-410(+)